MTRATATARQSLTERLFGHLASQILTGVHKPGDHLPPERTLAETWNVNRQVVREATKRLAQLGLVRITQGDGTRVLDYLECAGLDVLTLMAEVPAAATSGSRLLASMLEMRSAIAIDLARLCAMRSAPALRAQLITKAEAMARADSNRALFDLDVEYWDLVHQGADNVAYRLIYNTLRKSALAIRTQIEPWQAVEIRGAEFRMPLARAIATGDTKLAEQQAAADFRGPLEKYLPLITAFGTTLSSAQLAGALDVVNAATAAPPTAGAPSAPLDPAGAPRVQAARQPRARSPKR